MDHSAARATFVEIAFALNTLFVIYSAMREALRAHLAKKMKEYRAKAFSLEKGENGDQREDDLPHLNAIKRHLNDISLKHIRFQDKFVSFSTRFSIFMAIVCVVILWLDFLDAIGKFEAVLLTPLLLYVAGTFLNRLVFVVRGEWILGRFKIFLWLAHLFEPKDR